MKNLARQSNWNLFLDDHVLSRVTGFDRVIHHPRALGVVIPADQPWETTGVGLNFVDRLEDGTFIAFYRAMWWDAGIADALSKDDEDIAHHILSAMAYATSEDGIHWNKPTLGLLEAPTGGATQCAGDAPYVGDYGQYFPVMCDVVVTAN